MKRFIVLFGILFYFLINIYKVTCMADATYDSDIDFELYGESALLMDGKTGEVLYEKNGFRKRSIASTTKVLTCLIALEEGNMDDIVTISSNAAAQPDVQMHISEGEQYRLKDLLTGMMLESYNDVSVAVAEHIAGSTELFAEKMNEKAKQIGCKKSFFITPNGLDAQIANMENGATAYDLALVLAEAIKNDDFLSITQTKIYTIRELNEKRVVDVYNRNSFLESYEGLISGKTGFTGKAGYCYVGAAKREDRIFVAVTLGSGWPPHKTYKWEDMKKLFDYGFENYTYKKLEVQDSLKQKRLWIKNAKGNYYKEKVYVDVSIPLENTTRLLKCSDKYYGEVIIPDFLEAPVKKNQIIGNVNIFINGKLIESRKIKMPYIVEKQSFWSKFYQILCYIFDRICRKSIEIT